MGRNWKLAEMRGPIGRRGRALGETRTASCRGRERWGPTRDPATDASPSALALGTHRSLPGRSWWAPWLELPACRPGGYPFPGGYVSPWAGLWTGGPMCQPGNGRAARGLEGWVRNRSLCIRAPEALASGPGPFACWWLGAKVQSTPDSGACLERGKGAWPPQVGLESRVSQDWARLST